MKKRKVLQRMSDIIIQFKSFTFTESFGRKLKKIFLEGENSSFDKLRKVSFLLILEFILRGKSFSVMVTRNRKLVGVENFKEIVEFYVKRFVDLVSYRCEKFSVYYKSFMVNCGGVLDIDGVAMKSFTRSFISSF